MACRWDTSVLTGQNGTASYGVQNQETGEAVNDSTLFMIASCLKPVTALAGLKLYDEGEINLDDDISQYLPFEVSNPHHPDESITFRMLLTHTSSLKDNWDVLDPLYTIEEGGDSPLELGQFVRDYFDPSGKYYDPQNNFLGKEPGQERAYCNMGYALLGHAIEVISGQSFSEYMRDEIFRPLGMHNSYWFLKDIPHDNIARPHVLPDEEADNEQSEMLKHYGYPDFPDGQLRTTTRDYLKFVRLILDEGKIDGEQFISTPVIEQFHTVQFPSLHKYQAVAWNYNEFDHWLYYLLMQRLPSHTGGDPGVATVASFDPENDRAAVVFVNSPPNTFWDGKIFYMDLVKKLLYEAGQQADATLE